MAICPVHKPLDLENAKYIIDRLEFWADQRLSLIYGGLCMCEAIFLFLFFYWKKKSP